MYECVYPGSVLGSSYHGGGGGGYEPTAIELHRGVLLCVGRSHDDSPNDTQLPIIRQSQEKGKRS